MKILIFIFCVVIFISTNLNAQTKPELTSTDLANHTYYFDLKNDEFIGNGADFLKKEIAQNQYFLLGEYHGSYGISEFTKALIPLLHDNSYRYFGLEIGPVSNQILSELSKESAKTKENLHKFNSRYYVPTKRRDFTPIPFFSNVEDADFLSEATKRNWHLIGLDQEFSYSYIPLLDRMFANLSKKKKNQLKASHARVIELVKNAYKIGDEGGKRHFLTIDESKEYHSFLTSASENNPRNKAIAEALQKTTEIYSNNANRRYFAANSARIDYMKQNLREEFARTKFNLKTDKMLLKMGGVHTAKGFGNLSLYEIGNTLNELAKFHGNNSLHTTFLSRFYVDDDGKEIDGLADKESFNYRFKAFLQMAKKDRWTIIDLRPLRSNVFYARKYDLDEVVLNIFKLHDIVIIPKIEIDATRNFDLQGKRK